MKFLQSAIIVGVSAFMLAAPCMGENIIFPRFRSGISDVSGIVDVVKAYAVDNTGKTDVTAKLQQALDEHQNLVTIYLPNGTYLVSNTITMTPPCASVAGTGCINGPILQGQSRTNTVIMLKPNTFASGSSKAVIKSADWVAQNFNRGIHNLRVLVGSGNPSADGIFWYANNTGLMSEVDIIAEDGNGNIGMNLGSGEQGPCGARDIYVKGFKTGCSSDALNSVTVWNLTIENATTCGVANNGNTLFIQNLVCANAATGVRNNGELTLVDARFTGGNSSNAAVNNSGQLFARAITAQGYSRAISGGSAPSGLTVSEYSTGRTSLFASPNHSMNLPIKQMPVVPWEQDSTKWGNIEVYKGGLGTRLSDSAGLQKAIDDPKNTTVIIPSGRGYSWSGDVYVRGNIQRIVGTFMKFNGPGRLVVTNDLLSPVVKIERTLDISIVNQSNKTVILESIAGLDISITNTGTGELYISDFVGGMLVDAPLGRMWAWQFNAEGSGPPFPHVSITVNNIKTWSIFGWKDEVNGTALELKKGALEILGFCQYSNMSGAEPMFIIGESGEFTLAGEAEVWFGGSGYTNLVQQTRGGATKTLTRSQNGGNNMPLFVGYDSVKVANAVPVHRLIAPDRQIPGPRVNVRGGALFVAGMEGAGEKAAPFEIFSIDGSRPVMRIAQSIDNRSYCITGLPAGAYVVSPGNGWKSGQTVVIP